MTNSRRLNSYERRKADRAFKRRERYLQDRNKRLFEKLLEQRANEQRLKDALDHEKEIKCDN
jgi:hypothetical protein